MKLVERKEREEKYGENIRKHTHRGTSGKTQPGNT